MTNFQFSFPSAQPIGARPTSPANGALDPAAITDVDHARAANQTPAPVAAMPSASTDFSKRQTAVGGAFGAFQKTTTTQPIFGQPFGGTTQTLGAVAAAERAEEQARKYQELLHRVQPKRKVVPSWLFDEYYRKLSYEELQELRARPLGNPSRFKLSQEQADEPVKAQFEKIENTQNATQVNVFDWTIKPDQTAKQAESRKTDIQPTNTFTSKIQPNTFMSFEQFKMTMQGQQQLGSSQVSQSTTAFQFGFDPALNQNVVTTNKLQVERERIQTQLQQLQLADNSWVMEPVPQELESEIRGLTIKNRFGLIQFSSELSIETIDLEKIRLEDRYFEVFMDLVSYVAVLYNVQSSPGLQQQCQQRGLELISCEQGRLILKK